MSERSGDDPVVVVGTGPSGAAAAARLLGHGRRVLMLDSGGRTPRGLVVKVAGNTVFRWRDQSHMRSDRLGPESDDDVVWFSVLGLGGLSNFWTGAVPRFAPPDFDEGGRLDERFVWPIRYDDLEPYYRIAEHYLDITAGAPIRGVPPNDARYEFRVPPDWTSIMNNTGGRFGVIPLAKGAPTMVARRGVEFDSYHCIIEDLVDRPGFELRTGAHVERLCWSTQERRVTAVEYFDRASGSRRKTAVSAAIVAAGTIDTTMILRRSVSDDFPAGLGNTYGVLGTHLHDHPREWWRAELDRAMRALSHPLYLARRDYDESVPLMATSHTVGLASPVDRLRTWVGAKSSHLGVQVFGTMVPEPEHRVALEPGGDPLTQRATIHLRYDRQAVENLESSRHRLIDVLSSAGLPVRVPGPFHDLKPGSSVHLAGSARMHADPRLGVVDGNSRIHDVPNVYVGDMSVFTTGPEKNPTLTSMALAIRSADHLCRADNADVPVDGEPT